MDLTGLVREMAGINRCGKTKMMMLAGRLRSRSTGPGRSGLSSGVVILVALSRSLCSTPAAGSGFTQDFLMLWWHGWTKLSSDSASGPAGRSEWA